MGEKQAEKKEERRPLYEMKDGKLIRRLKECPRCGRGTFMAHHSDRWTCGKCGYTEFLRRS
jgi:small subunit ribosomal protein S27Ae